MAMMPPCSDCDAVRSLDTGEVAHEQNCPTLKRLIDRGVDKYSVIVGCQSSGEPWPAPVADSPLSRPTPIPQPANGAPISKEELLEFRKRLFAKLDGILLAKGNDYNATQQDAGDTLFNLRTCSILGIVPCPEDGILVRLSDKLMRLISLTRPSTVQKVKDESIEDTGGDAINYITYLLAMRAKKAGTL